MNKEMTKVSASNHYRPSQILEWQHQEQCCTHIIPRINWVYKSKIITSSSELFYHIISILGLCVNTSDIKHLLAKVDFGCKIDHLVLAYVMKSKTEPAHVKFRRLIEVFSAYLFNMPYMNRRELT